MSDKATEPVAQELALAIVQATGAASYLATSIAHSARDFEVMAAHDATGTSERLRQEFVLQLRFTLRRLNWLMNDLGDFINAHDGVEKGDEEATTAAFRRVGQVLKETWPSET